MKCCFNFTNHDDLHKLIQRTLLRLKNKLSSSSPETGSTGTSDAEAVTTASMDTEDSSDTTKANNKQISTHAPQMLTSSENQESERNTKLTSSLKQPNTLDTTTIPLRIGLPKAIEEGRGQSTAFAVAAVFSFLFVGSTIPLLAYVLLRKTRKDKEKSSVTDLKKNTPSDTMENSSSIPADSDPVENLDEADLSSHTASLELSYRKPMVTARMPFGNKKIIATIPHKAIDESEFGYSKKKKKGSEQSDKDNALSQFKGHTQPKV